MCPEPKLEAPPESVLLPLLELELLPDPVRLLLLPLELEVCPEDEVELGEET